MSSILLSYYPTYYVLDEGLSINNSKDMNIFIDLKNNLQPIYLENVARLLVESTIKINRIDTSIFESFLEFIAWHRKYAIMKKINLKFFIFFESGQSHYHINLDDKYKANRHINDYLNLGIEKRELFKRILNANLLLIKEFCNQIPDIFIFGLEHFEADFIPYYLISRKDIDEDEKSINLIYTNDHDILQVLSLGKNNLIYRKIQKHKKLIKKGFGVAEYLKDNSLRKLNIDEDFIPLIISIIGDKGDNIYGIKKLGEKTLIKVLPELIEMIDDIDNLYEKIELNKNIFEDFNTDNKILNIIFDNEKIVKKNLQMTSFELISRFVDYSSNHIAKEIKKQISEVLDNKNIIEKNEFLQILQENRIDFMEDAIDLIYHEI